MKIRKAVITAAGPKQRALPVQTLLDRDGAEKSVLAILLEEALAAGVDEIGVVIAPGDREPFARAAGAHAARVRFLEQRDPRGYGHALWCAREFVQEEPFLHMIGDHLYVSAGGRGCAREVADAALAHRCAVSAVQPTRETDIPRYGTVGGQPLAGHADLYRVESVVEKPTPTEAEQRLIVPGLRSGYYLCFFGVHVLTAAVMEILAGLLASGTSSISLSPALDALAVREQYLALASHGRRYDIGARYGLFKAQLALAMSGRDREQVLLELLEVAAGR